MKKNIPSPYELRLIEELLSRVPSYPAFEFDVLFKTIDTSVISLYNKNKIDFASALILVKKILVDEGFITDQGGGYFQLTDRGRDLKKAGFYTVFNILDRYEKQERVWRMKIDNGQFKMNKVIMWATIVMAIQAVLQVIELIYKMSE